eukprot:gnl/MRDRNA2_/MRDRNA2_72686_c0_seq1.p1 gnl/MRDRNA2_/MRDRNA2_72686_c0~~gnl/MRDRNA2_/MRDRNA2_72686_c0_seq1.p1  ORF type:complete len:194 (+),score=30.20 gnl/MRDRNA2_/MRDRNA2_72686_c0_seq1:89-670(+)
MPYQDREGSDGGQEGLRRGSRGSSLFQKWLVTLKFLSGWNDQSKFERSELESWFRSFLRREGVEEVDEVCQVVVPMMLNVRKIDMAVVRHVKACDTRGEQLKACKNVQVNILRVLAHELLESKFNVFSTDPASLAKIVQHFRFDKSFNELLQVLTNSLKRSGQGALSSKKDARAGSASRSRSPKPRQAARHAA